MIMFTSVCLMASFVKKRIDGGKGYQYKLINYNYYNSEGMKNG